MIFMQGICNHGRYFCDKISNFIVMVKAQECWSVLKHVKYRLYAEQWLHQRVINDFTMSPTLSTVCEVNIKTVYNNNGAGDTQGLSETLLMSSLFSVRSLLELGQESLK